MELFHQTVSMKSVGNLTDFVRDHMLEPFDAAKWTANIVAHFEDLTKAHEAVQRARAQLSALGPLLAECDAHDKVVAEIAALTAQRNALKYYFADLKAGLVDRLLDDLSSERAQLRAQLTELATRLKDLRSRERSLDIELAGHGGNRLAEIDRLLERGRGRVPRPDGPGRAVRRSCSPRPAWIRSRPRSTSPPAATRSPPPATGPNRIWPMRRTGSPTPGTRPRRSATRRPGSTPSWSACASTRTTFPSASWTCGPGCAGSCAWTPARCRSPGS